MCAVCLGGVCVCAFSTLRLVSVYSCAGIFVLLCAYVFFFFSLRLSFVRLLLVYIQMKMLVFLFLLYSHTEEGRI